MAKIYPSWKLSVIGHQWSQLSKGQTRGQRLTDADYVSRFDKSGLDLRMVRQKPPIDRTLRFKWIHSKILLIFKRSQRKGSVVHSFSSLLILALGFVSRMASCLALSTISFLFLDETECAISAQNRRFIIIKISNSWRPENKLLSADITRWDHLPSSCEQSLSWSRWAAYVWSFWPNHSRC